MNYNHLNKVYDYWRKKILPYLSHNFTVGSFDEYLKQFSFLPSGKWMKDFVCVKLSRVGMAVDPEKFVKKYKDVCVTYVSPVKPEDGIQRVIYQISPTLHIEFCLWVWIEHEEVFSYGSLFACYHNEQEFLKFSDEMIKIRREGNTEERPIATGFAGFAGKHS